MRRVRNTLQALIRWRGTHEDEWLVWSRCDKRVQMEARVMEKRKYPRKPAKAQPAARPQPTRDRSHLRRGVCSPPPAKRSRLSRVGGGTPGQRKRPLSPGALGVSRWLAHGRTGYGVGAGRSVRGLPLVWESPAADELRGRKWLKSPGEVRAEAAPVKRRGVGVADERVAKKRKEGRTLSGREAAPA